MYLRAFPIVSELDLDVSLRHTPRERIQIILDNYLKAIESFGFVTLSLLLDLNSYYERRVRLPDMSSLGGWKNLRHLLVQESGWRSQQLRVDARDVFRVVPQLQTLSLVCKFSRTIKARWVSQAYFDARRNLEDDFRQKRTCRNKNNEKGDNSCQESSMRPTDMARWTIDDSWAMNSEVAFADQDEDMENTDYDDYPEASFPPNNNNNNNNNMNHSTMLANFSSIAPRSPSSSPFSPPPSSSAPSPSFLLEPDPFVSISNHSSDTFLSRHVRQSPNRIIREPRLSVSSFDSSPSVFGSFRRDCNRFQDDAVPSVSSVPLVSSSSSASSMESTSLPPQPSPLSLSFAPPTSSSFFGSSRPLEFPAASSGSGFFKVGAGGGLGSAGMDPTWMGGMTNQNLI
eukprot:CAMPEP_0175064368 /NCGR_PEP_ID=MMETSP0052_2-20121109/15291_1 /TAXON_ID=51329 ORGANISM="Polytomella parva, Strain SAG 63-3" /NCGR_SAMPLE_ID=MMETSP0052_2 /ASSEMBLY_ACC=CAM_ASM_000194 /LENGTH=398 /DNA_ID=CAMNT_0016330705 /DNA_START=301 /DNA_END=1497 /DNA_ORIENTATION=+